MFPRETPNHSNIRQKGKSIYFPLTPLLQ
jgi:hypothetical protein